MAQFVSFVNSTVWQVEEVVCVCCAPIVWHFIAMPSKECDVSIWVKVDNNVSRECEVNGRDECGQKPITSNVLGNTQNTKHNANSECATNRPWHRRFLKTWVFISSRWRDQMHYKIRKLNWTVIFSFHGRLSTNTLAIRCYCSARHVARRVEMASDVKHSTLNYMQCIRSLIYRKIFYDITWLECDKHFEVYTHIFVRNKLNSLPIRWFALILSPHCARRFHSLLTHSFASSVLAVRTAVCGSIGIYSLVRFFCWDRFKLNMYDVETTHKSFNNTYRECLSKENTIAAIVIVQNSKNVFMLRSDNCSHTIFATRQ